MQAEEKDFSIELFGLHFSTSAGCIPRSRLRNGIFSSADIFPTNGVAFQQTLGSRKYQNKTLSWGDATLSLVEVQEREWNDGMTFQTQEADKTRKHNKRRRHSLKGTQHCLQLTIPISEIGIHMDLVGRFVGRWNKLIDTGPDQAMGLSRVSKHVHHSLITLLHSGWLV